MAELKPCPFCGGTNVEVLNEVEAQPDLALIGLTKDNWFVCCNSCFAGGGVRRTAAEAVEAWERRDDK